jgi:hypothetical protein
MRKLFVLAVGILAAGLLTIAVSAAAAGASSHPAVHGSAPTAAACASTSGSVSGIVHATRVGCQAHNTSDAANGTPPLIWHGGAVMGTSSTGPVVVTPIYWNPAGGGHPMASRYKSIITTYLAGVAHDSGLHTNVYSTLNEYFGSNGTISYQVQLGTPIDDTNRLPANGCTVASNDTTSIYADGSGYNACLDDDQVIAETARVVTAKNLPVDLGHIYVLFLAKHVESCFFPGSTTGPPGSNFCTINHQPTATYCAYHSQSSSGMVYGNLPYPIYASPVGFTCSSDARFPVVQTPNHNADADTEVSPTSHEIMEAITDPDTVTGWYDSSGFENGDECAYVFGATQGQAGQFYNQVINGHRYLTQEEFSNNDFFNTGLGCLQGE